MSEWIRVEDELPCIYQSVQVVGGTAYFDGKHWRTEMAGDYGQVIQWQVTKWKPIEASH